MFYIISCDISNDKARLNIFKILKNYGTHVQYSVFEATLTNKQFDKLISDLRKIKINKACDSIIIYSLTKPCLKNKLIVGNFSGDNDISCYIA